MAYVFKEGDLPSLIDAKQARERIFFVNQELAHIDDMLAGVMHYKKDAASPLHLHKNCEHFYFIIDGKATVESDEGVRPVGPGDMIFIPAEEKHRLRARRRCSISSSRRPTVSRQRSSKAPTTTCAGSARTAKFGFRPELA